MNPTPWQKKPAFSTPWFTLLERRPADQPDAAPYYSLAICDYVCAVALTTDQRFVMVRQYRPAVEQMTLELPAGTVDPGEAPEDCIRRELEEETGYRSGGLVHLGTLTPDTGRLSNRMWCYLAQDVEPLGKAHPTEAGIETILLSAAELSAAIATAQVDHALHLAALFLAVMQKRLSLSWPADYPLST